MSKTRDQVEALARAAHQAARAIRFADAVTRTSAILGAARALRAREAEILAANAQDVAEATSADLAPAMLDRLRLDPARLESIIAAAEAVAAQPDPVGEALETWSRPNGLRITRRRVPIGLIAIVYESRPNVTVEAALLCLRSGNACILRGGSESLRTNLALGEALADGLATVDLPRAAIAIVPTTDREAVAVLGSLSGVIDLIVPRGGPGLIAAVTATSRVPVVKHDAGICHLYVQTAADLAMAETIVVNAKCQRPGVCNAVETLLVDAAIAPRFLPQLATVLASQKTEVRACPAARALMPGSRAATEFDWDTEHLALILNIKVVTGIDEALTHIACHSTGHSEAIVTADDTAARRFLAEVDSACVYHNASTRFTDGGEFGFGAEVGISTGRLHARGPMGARELTTWKFTVEGSGQVRN